MKYEKQYIINKELNQVKDIFSDLMVFGSFHPLIKSVTKVENQKTGIPQFKILEQPFNWLPFKISYLAQVKCDNDTIEYHISGIPFFKPTTRYALNSTANNQTQLTFFLTINGIGIGKRILRNKMVDAQDSLVESINKVD